MTTRPLMVAGTGSGVGKSSLVAGLGRVLDRRGYDVAPFKAQNMSNNSHIAREGGEIAVSQFMQSRACRSEPTVHMNPILLKPNGDGASEVVVHGTPDGVMEWSGYRDRFFEMRGYVRESYDRIAENHDVVLLEGAGSPAEPNLMDHDLVNLSLAERLNAPVVLVGDISHGGVFAWLLGTVRMLEPDQRDLIEGIVINKFRGDKTVLKDAITDLEDRLDLPILGVLPHSDRARLPAEDSRDLASLETRARVDEPIEACLIEFPHLSNFTDFEPLANHPTVAMDVVKPPNLPTDPDLVVLPGTKNTLRDLRWLKKNNLHHWLEKQRTNNTRMLGVCGGYQMMGTDIRDPDGLESDLKQEQGLGWFDFSVEYRKPKLTRRVSGVLGDNDTSFSGYEVRYGRFVGGQDDVWARDGEEILARGEPDRLGTSVHGLFQDENVLNHYLSRISETNLPERDLTAGSSVYAQWADVVEEHLDVGRFVEILDGRGASATAVDPS